MGKIIFWIVVFFLVLLALRMISVHKSRREAREEKDERAERDAKSGRDTTPVDDAMVKCTSCGVFIPKKNSVLTKNGASCGRADCNQLNKV